MVARPQKGPCPDEEELNNIHQNNFLEFRSSKSNGLMKAFYCRSYRLESL